MQDLDEVHPHLTRNMGKDLMTILEFHEKRCVWQRLFYYSIDLDRALL